MTVLEERWRSDRSPRVFLQLADELRRVGRSGRAIEVLRDGLSWHPESVSGWVALGRLRLDEGDADGAIEALESALERDPAQLVASRLLTEAWIRVGDGEKAEASLERSRLLSLPDGDYEALAAGVRALADGPAAAAGAERPGPSSGGGPFALSPPDPLPELDLRRIGPGRRGWMRVEVADEPFAELLAARQRSPAGGEPRPLAGRIFDLPVAAAAPAEVEPVVEPAEVVAAKAAHEVAEDPAGDIVGRTAAAPLEPVFEPLTIGEEVERETFEASPAPAPPPAATGEPAATSTLAALYLAQGHLDEAEAEYRRVLTDRPDDAEALAGLLGVSARRSAPAPPSAPPPAGLTARKLLRLRGLHQSLRARRQEGRARVS